GLYDCKKAWELLREGKTAASEAFGQGVFAIWAQSEQVQPLIEYLARQATGKKPLELCGCDCQFTAAASRKLLSADLTAVLDQLPQGAVSAEQKMLAVKSLEQMTNDPKAGADADQRAALQACRKALEMKPTEKLPERELAFWRQFLDSSLVMAEAQSHIKGKETEAQQRYGNLRDTQMGKNLVWLARTAYPDRKIIVWAATFHVMRNQENVLMV